MFRRLAVLLAAVVAALFGWANAPTRALPDGTVADSVVVRKADRRLDLYRGGERIKTYRVSLGRRPTGDKTREGDARTPEGRYVLDSRNPQSGYHRALHISYPSVDDRAEAERRSVSPGGDIMVHGLRNGFGGVGRLHRAVDWTLGCVALTNAEIDELWRVVPDGTPITLLP